MVAFVVVEVQEAEHCHCRMDSNLPSACLVCRTELGFVALRCNRHIAVGEAESTGIAVVEEVANSHSLAAVEVHILEVGSS